MRTFPRPIVVVSKCLDLAACRYNGERIRAPFISMLQEHVELRPICPEVEIGLGVPRHPIRLVRIDRSTRLVQPKTGKDVTTAMQDFSHRFLVNMTSADGFILKGRSPSCGIKDVKVYSGSGNPLGTGPGVFAGLVLERYPDAAIEDEGRLTNARLRHHFLVKIFARAAFRAVRRTAAMAPLVAFHARHKLQLMANNQAALRVAGRTVANPEKLPIARVLDAYEEQLARALARPARARANVNALQHAFGYFKKQVGSREKKHFLTTLDDYGAERVLLDAPLMLIQSWIERFEDPYLEEQTFFQPYPRPLLHLRDSGRE